MQGNGKPQDDYDQICQNMQMCMKCAVIDTDYECDPLVDTYNATISWFGSKSETLMADCSSDNSNECASFLCTCLLNLLWRGLWADNSLKHGLNFNHDTKCLNMKSG